MTDINDPFGPSDRMKKVIAVQRGGIKSHQKATAADDVDNLNAIINGDVEEQEDPYSDHLDKLRKMYTSAFDAQSEQRDEADLHLDYYHGIQLRPEILEELRRRKQPPAYLNRVRPGIQGTLGLLDSNQTDPEAIARNDNDDGAAQTVTQILRYESDKNDFQNTKRDCSFDHLVQGVTAAAVEVDDQGDSQISQIPYREFFYDPYSIHHDFRDAKFLGRAKFVDREEAQRIFPEYADWFWSTTTECFMGTGPYDSPQRQKLWLDDRRRVCLIEIYFIDDSTGQWLHANFCHAGVMDYGPSAYKDDTNNTICPFVGVSYEIDRKFNRYGMIRDMIPLQDGINARNSRMLHLTNSAQVEATSEAALPTDRNTARSEANRADGALPMGWKRIPTQDIFQGNQALLSQHIAEIERMAPTPALLGRAGGANESGRARQVLQQAGLTELARAFARWEHWELRVFRHVWWNALNHMTDKRMIRITDNAGVKQTLQINYPTGQVKTTVDPQTGQPVQQPVLANELSQMDMDVTLKTVQQADSLRDESIKMVLEWSQKTGISMMDPSFELVLELIPFPNKEYLLNKWKELAGQQQAQQQAQQEAQQQQAQQMMEIQQESTRAKTMKSAADAEKSQALAGLHQIQAQKEASEADTEWKHQQVVLQNEKLTLQIRQIKAHLGLDPDQPFPNGDA